ncbi:MAG: hypothetical protein IKB05_03355 [Alphaproteobacteria bacterium]|nr:hypothetical protein [Alphaproteobacteria bacterium]
MDWFDYYRKVSLSQFARAAHELRALRGQLRQAENDLEYSAKLLTKNYGIEDDIKYGDACLKLKEIIEPTNLLDESACRFTLSRCQFFKPIGNEELCPNHMCSCWAHNNRYHQDLNQVKEIKQKILTFWSDKLSKVK